MAGLRDYLDPDCVVAGLEETDREGVVRSLVKLLAAAGKVLDPETLVRDVLERERLAPTGLGEACAVPHAQSASVETTVLAAASLAKPVDFCAPDNKPASLVFLMAGPKDSAGLHLKLLSKLARFMHDPEFRQAALQAADGPALSDLIFSRDT